MRAGPSWRSIVARRRGKFADKRWVRRTASAASAARLRDASPPAVAPAIFPARPETDIISCFWAGDVAFSILKKCLNPNHTHELLLLEESK